MHDDRARSGDGHDVQVVAELRGGVVGLMKREQQRIRLLTVVGLRQIDEIESAERAAAPPAATELALMQRIQAALRSGKPRLALELSDEHAQRWPTGLFREEREGVRALASCQLDLAKGQSRARAFLQKYPEGALAPRVRASCRLQPARRSVNKL